MTRMKMTRPENFPAPTGHIVPWADGVAIPEGWRAVDLPAGAWIQKASGEIPQIGGVTLGRLRQPVQLGATLAGLLNELIDDLVTDERSRSDIIGDMAEAAGIESSTVNQILDGSIKCPCPPDAPDQRLRGFAEVLGVSKQSLIDAARKDGCACAEDDDDEADSQAAPCGDCKSRASLYMPLRFGHSDGGRREYGVTFIQAGRVRRRDGELSNWSIPRETVQAAIEKFGGVAVFIDHAISGFFSPTHPSIRDLIAVTFGSAWNEEAGRADGGIRLYSRPDLEWLQVLLDEIVADQAAGRETPDVGLSLVFFGDSEWGEDADGRPFRTTKSIDYVESCDIVFGPGARGRIREVLSRVDPGALNRMEVLMSEEIRTTEEAVTSAEAAANDLPPSVDGYPSSDHAHTMRMPLPSEMHSQSLSHEAPAGRHNHDASSVQNPAGLAIAEPLPIVPRDPVHISAPPVASLPDHGERLSRLETVIGRLADSVETMANLERRQVHREERRVISEMGVGVAPRNPVAISGRTDLERFAPAVDWLFGVADTPLPDPQYRRADTIYLALTGDWEWRGNFDRERVALASASPITLPDLAVNAMNKVVAMQFSRLLYWRWYELVARVAPNDGSLHDMQWITHGGTGNLPTVEDGAAYTEGELGDVREADSFEKRGRFVGITRKMLKNSDIQRIQSVPVALATDAVRTRSAKISDIFTSNSGVGPTLDQDSTALFHADHNNIATTALGTDTTAWETASQECFDQTEISSSKKIALFAKYNLVPSALFFQGLKNFGYGDGSPTTYNPFAVADRSPEDPRPVVLAVPDWTDATDWAYLADPNIWPVIMMTYSQSPGGGSHPLPELFAVTNETGGLMFTNDTMPIKVRDEWAAGVNGYRGIGKRNVA